MKIDYFEFLVLIEASWSSGTILRHSIMQKAINVWYHELTKNERLRAFEFFKKTQKETESIQIEFMDRFNHDNQYHVFLKKGKEKQNAECYFSNGQYKITTNTFCPKEYIIKIVDL